MRVAHQSDQSDRHALGFDTRGQGLIFAVVYPRRQVMKTHGDGPGDSSAAAGDAILEKERKRKRERAHTMVLSESVRRLLTSGHTAHLVTLNPDGSPQVSLVWVGLDGEEVVCAHLGMWNKVRNMRQDARVALSLETGEKTGGVVDYVVLSGRARITEGGAPELLQQLAQVYLGPGIKYPPSDHAPAGYITHIQIERVYGQGSWQTSD